MGVIKSALKRALPEQVLDIHRLADAHRTAHGRFPRILRPRTFSERVFRRLMFDRRPILTQFADKYGARAYIEERLGSVVLPRLYHVTEDPATIPWESLPSRYVVKATHGSGWIRLVEDGGADRAAITQACSQWLRRNFYPVHREWPYKNIPPRIIIEEFLDDGSGGVPLDFKFFVFHGVPRLIQVDATRFSGHTRSLYDLGWNRLPVTLRFPPVPHEVPRPVHLEQMIAAAAELGRGIDFLRVDLYDTPRQFYVGELTTAPGAGREAFDPPEFDRELGRFWRGG